MTSVGTALSCAPVFKLEDPFVEDRARLGAPIELKLSGDTDPVDTGGSDPDSNPDDAVGLEKWLVLDPVVELGRMLGLETVELVSDGARLDGSGLGPSGPGPELDEVEDVELELEELELEELESEALEELEFDELEPELPSNGDDCDESELEGPDWGPPGPIFEGGSTTSLEAGADGTGRAVESSPVLESESESKCDADVDGVEPEEMEVGELEEESGLNVFVFDEDAGGVG